MNDFKWFDFESYPFSERFPGNFSWIAGLKEWDTGVRQFPFNNPDDALLWLDAIRTAQTKPSSRLCPRVFLSHRQSDKDVALRVAYLSWSKGFDFWIDVIDLDPATNAQIKRLEASIGRPLNLSEKAILIAAIIEMALLNCTHVIAVMTGATAGSQWVPYEYGRVKEARVRSSRVACWWDSTSLRLGDLPEYLHLSQMNKNEAEVLHWLQDEMKLHIGKGNACSGKPRGVWAGAIPAPLPTG